MSFWKFNTHTKSQKKNPNNLFYIGYILKRYFGLLSNHILKLTLSAYIFVCLLQNKYASHYTNIGQFGLKWIHWLWVSESNEWGWIGWELQSQEDFLWKQRILRNVKALRLTFTKVHLNPRNWGLIYRSVIRDMGLQTDVRDTDQV